MDVPEERGSHLPEESVSESGPATPPASPPGEPGPPAPTAAAGAGPSFPLTEQERFAAEWSAIVDDLTSQGVGMAPRESTAIQPPAPARGERLLGFSVWVPRPETAPVEQPGGHPAAAGGKPFDDGDHFVPAPPPPIPEGTPVSRLAWLGTLGGPAVLIGSALTGYDLPQVLSIAAGLSFLAGFATLVWLLPEGREDGWDDGAQV